MNQCEVCGDYREDLARLVLYDPWTNEREVYDFICLPCADKLQDENNQAYHDLDLEDTHE